MYPLRRITNSILPSRLHRADQFASQGFREFRALHDVSLEIKKGQSWGFIGENGSGKSTLLRIISGNLRPSAGSVEVDGKVAILDYGSGFNGDFTGRENIFLKGALLGLSRKTLEDRFLAITEFADIGEFIDQPVKTYSSGMSARLGFAIMTHVDADIMITDEALAVGDAFFVQKCMRHIRSFLKRGTFLFVSHSTNDVLSLCDHAVWLDHGNVRGIGKASEVCQAYMASIERRRSTAFLAEGARDGEANSVKGAASAAEATDGGPVGQVAYREPKEVTFSGAELAALKNHYATPPWSDCQPPLPFVRFEICEHHAEIEDVLSGDGAVGGGKIFSVTITGNESRNLTSILGGEIVCLTVRAVAEKPIRRPIVGFQLKNPRGLTLVAENTFVITRDQDMSLLPGEVVTAHFRFSMPLVPLGEYVVRAGLADGVEDNNALIDVRHDALVLRCETSGSRHGLVGVPMLSIEVVRESAPDLG
jgi:lipopolysaccharide transport system ATP-binding protein